ncbi:hypothetical protein [Vaginella massiliensis]|uniref:hypothetical protein n=2 Tax=Flavobacteriales TaxID=200644 RepID=UPI000838112E|nr:hypothetical protein [Vaginella massiliensis]
MKKFILKGGLIIALASSSIFYACNNDDDTVEQTAELQGKKSPVIGEDIFFRSDYKEDVTKGGGVTFVFDIGRRSSPTCKGFGICRLAAFGIWIVVQPKANQAIGIDKQSSLKFITIELESPIDPAEFDTRFYVDEEIIDDNGNYKIKAGVYNLDSTIGLYGGYKLPYFEL